MRNSATFAEDPFSTEAGRALWKNVGTITYLCGNDSPRIASGFVVDECLGFKKHILTCAHTVDDVNKPITICLHEDSKSIRCTPVLVDWGLDLLLLKPSSEPSVPGLSLDLNSTPKLLDPVLLLGAGATFDISSQTGDIHARSIDGSEVNRILNRLGQPNLVSNIAPFVRVIRHNAESYNGYSGSPLINASHKVIGIHHGGMPSGRLGFAIDVKHVNELKDKVPKQGVVLAKVQSCFQQAAALRQIKSVEQKEFKVRCDGEDIDAGVYIAGRIEPNTPEFKSLTERLLPQLKEVDAQRLMANRKFYSIRNDAFGLSFHSPAEYAVRVQRLEHKPGVLIDFGTLGNNGEFQTKLPIEAYLYRLDRDAYFFACQDYFDSLLLKTEELIRLAQSETVDRFEVFRKRRASHILKAQTDGFVENFLHVDARVELPDDQRQVPMTFQLTRDKYGAWWRSTVLKVGTKTFDLRFALLDKSVLICVTQDNENERFYRDARLIQDTFHLD